MCSLNCLNLFLKYKIGQTCLVCICVVFGSLHALHLDLSCVRMLNMLLGHLFEYAIMLHSSCVFFLSWKTLLPSSQQLLYIFSIVARHKSFLSGFLGFTSITFRQLGRSIKPNFCVLCLLDTSSTPSRSIEVSGQLLDRFSTHLLIYRGNFLCSLPAQQNLDKFSFIASCFITLMHLYGFLVPL